MEVMNEKSITVIDQKTNALVEKMTDSDIVPYKFDSERIEKKGCKLCEADFRDEVEAWFDDQKRKNYSDIKRKLHSEKQFDITVNAIRNHMLNHYQVMERNMSLSEYTEDLQKWVNMQTNRVASIKSRVGVLEREVMSLAYKSDDLDLIDRRKNAETIKKLMETIVLLESKLDTFKEEAEPVTLVFNQLKVIISDEMEHINSGSAKKVLVNVLSRLKESCGGMVLEQ